MEFHLRAKRGGVYPYLDSKVVEAPYAGLFAMVSDGRFDLFPRGLNEVYVEYEANRAANPQLAVDSGLLLYYPWSYYLFVCKKNPEIAKRIEKGLRIMIADGTFNSIFLKYHRNDIEKAKLKNRRVIELVNPLLPKSAPLNDKALWFDPAQGN